MGSFVKELTDKVDCVSLGVSVEINAGETRLRQPSIFIWLLTKSLERKPKLNPELINYKTQFSAYLCTLESKEDAMTEC